MVDNSDAFLQYRRRTSSPAATRELGAALGALCRGGELILLRGDLGSGKTCFVQGLAAGLGIDPELRVTSPTFILHAEYPGKLYLNHLDLYRLEEAAALEGLGIEDMLMDSGAVTAVEWPELLALRNGDACLDVLIANSGGNEREFVITAHGRKYAALLRRLP